MGVLLFLLMIVVLIVGHEFGHLLAAKRAGMQVPEFGIGFPPKLWSITIGDTEYSINALPFGGFVRIIGEDGDAEHPHAFSKKGKLAQAGVLAAGPFMNVVIGFFAFWLAFGIGVPAAITDAEREGAQNPRVIISEVLPGSPAFRAGLTPGDILLHAAYGGQVVDVRSPSDVGDVVSQHTEAVTLTISRGGEEREFTVTPETGIIKDKPEQPALGIGSILVADTGYGFFGSFVKALKATGIGVVNVVAGFVSLIAGAVTFSASLESVSGPVGIASLVGDAAYFGAGHVLMFAAIISLNLAVLNLLPFPALDGGRLAVLGIEVLRGRPIRQSVLAWVNTIGFALLILLMLVVTWNDIAKLLV